MPILIDRIYKGTVIFEKEGFELGFARLVQDHRILSVPGCRVMLNFPNPRLPTLTRTGPDRCPEQKKELSKDF